MLDFQALRSVTFDIGNTYEDSEIQEQTGELIWQLLERNYHIFVISTNGNRGGESEDFSHPGLVFLWDAMPPSAETRARYPQLLALSNLWVTNDEALSSWLIRANLPLATTLDPDASPATRIARIGCLADLKEALDPSIPLLREVERRIAALPADGFRTIALGGPPESGHQRLALHLKQQLEGIGYPLVDLLDLSDILVDSTQVPPDFPRQSEPGVPGKTPWVSDRAGEWITSELFTQVRAGTTVYQETLPEGLPKSLEPHFPLYLTPESVLIIHGEMLFQPSLRKLFDLKILLEVKPEVTTRQLYGIEEEDFDLKFVEQYLAKMGRSYQNYLETFDVIGTVDLRVDANVQGVFRLMEPVSSLLS